MQQKKQQLPERSKQLLTGVLESCGVYIFRSDTGTIIYIGKAVNLKRRVRQYFSRTNHALEGRKDALAKYISQVEWIPCPTELHALILEDELIKTHRPLYNRKLKKCLSYAYIGITSAPYPELVLLQPVDVAAFSTTGEVFGPFQDEFVVIRVLEIIRKAYLLRGCAGPLPSTACARQELRCCRSPCTGAVSARSYRTALRKARGFLNGDDPSLIKLLVKQMRKYSQAGSFEQAAACRDQLVFAKGLFLKNYFYRKFREGAYLLHSQGRWPGTFLFSRGELVFYTEKLLEEESCRKYLPLKEPVSHLPDRILYDRAMIVAAWSQSTRERRTYRFLEI